MLCNEDCTDGVNECFQQNCLFHLYRVTGTYTRKQIWKIAPVCKETDSPVLLPQLRRHWPICSLSRAEQSSGENEVRRACRKGVASKSSPCNKLRVLTVCRCRFRLWTSVELNDPTLSLFLKFLSLWGVRPPPPPPPPPPTKREGRLGVGCVCLDIWGLEGGKRCSGHIHGQAVGVGYGVRKVWKRHVVTLLLSLPQPP